MSWLLIGLLAGPILSVELPAEAQRYSIRRARRARQARLHRQRIMRERQQAAPVEDPGVDMDFTAHFDEEQPPPMQASDVEEVERREEEQRRSMLDPELFGEPSDTAQVAERGRYTPLTARASIGAFHRALTYGGYQAGGVANYDLPLGAMASIGVDYYPGAHVLNDALAHLALSWSFSHSIGVESTSAEGISYPSNAYAWLVGLRYRIPIDSSEIGLEVGGGEHGFHVERGALSDPEPSGVPPVDYDLLRFAVTGRFGFGDAAIGGRLAYLPVLGSGMLASARYFGGVETHGLEAAIDFTYAVGLGFEIFAEIEARLFVLDFAENAGGAAIASSAIDRYVAGRIGALWRMPAHAQM
jgi:hypothetical protein